MPPKLVVGLMGSSVVGGSADLSSSSQLDSFLKVLKSHGVVELDTARVYAGGKSEELLGALPSAQKEFKIATKAPGFSLGSLTYDKVINNSKLSHEALKQDKVDIYYIHGPDSQTPFEEQCRAFNDLYKQRRYERFGICNLNAKKVEQIVDICRSNGYVLPTVYQGAYNPMHRAGETDLFPALRKLGLAFYAYSPLAGGLLAKPLDQLLTPAEGSRYKEMPVFGNIYLKEGYVQALKDMQQICDENNLSLIEATLRWLVNHSPLQNGDSIILGAKNEQQVDETLTAAQKGPLPEAIVKGWEQLWRKVQEAGPLPSTM